MEENQLAPKAESYIPPPNFQFSPSQREIDFAQLLASGAAPVDALIRSSLVTAQEAAQLSQSKLYSMATRFLKSQAVQERIDYYLILHKASMSITVERLQQELAANAFADFAGAFNLDGTPIQNPHNLPRHLRAAIKEWGWDKDGQLKFKMHDKLKAAQMLGDLGGHFDAAHEAKATKVNISLGDGGGNNSPQPVTVDVSPSPLPTEPALPDCLL